MESKKKINIGLDIGVASVGWSLIDEDLNIVDLGVRLFDDVANAKDGSLENAKRRSARCSRRRLRRAKTRKQAFINFLIKNKQVDNEEAAYNLINIDINKFNVDNPIELKCKALKETISQEALIFILFHYIHHRGFFYETEEDQDKKSQEDEKDKSKNHEDKLLFPSQKIYQFYKENGWYKNSKIQDNFSAKQYEAEIREIFKTQKISQTYADEYCEIFNKVRSFEMGPGSQKSPTPYGMYYLENGKVVKREGENLWEALKGKCTYYEDEKRGGKNSPIAEVFNLLNDISNIHFFRTSDFKLDKEIKELIFKEYSNVFSIKTNTKFKAYNLTPKNLIKLIKSSNWRKDELENINESNIDGYRVKDFEKKDKIITELKSYNAIVDWLVKTQQVKENIQITNLDLLQKANDVFDKLSAYQDVNKRLDKLNEINDASPELNGELIKKLKGLSQTHSLSYKAMLDYINYSFKNLDKSNNQEVFFQEFIKSKTQNTKIETRKYIDKKVFNNEVISPTTKRTFIQTVNIINKLLKNKLKDYVIDNITIELPRDKNTAEERKKIDKAQKNNRKIVEKILSNNDDKPDRQLNYATRLRLKLWEEQSHRDIYDGKPIDYADAMSGKGLDIDHIIPFSISHDDSMNNKVLTKSEHNRNKSNRTPHQWFSNTGEFDKFCDDVDKYLLENNKTKAELLKSKLDPLDELSGFIGRNLADTRYASRLVLNTLQNFFKNNETYKNVKVKVIRGAMTNFARNHMFVSNGKTLLPKDRDVYHHHAIDASVVCYLGMNHKIKQLLNLTNVNIKNNPRFKIRKKDDNTGFIEDVETGEIINLFDNLDRSVIDFGKQLCKYNAFAIKDDDNNKELKLNELANKVKFSRMYVTKNNVQLSDETIYSMKWSDMEKTCGNIIKSLELLTISDKDLLKYFGNNPKEQDKLFCYKSDKTLYDALNGIVKRYSNAKNPFLEYMKVEHQIENPSFILLDKNKRVKKLKINGDEKNLDNLIVLDGKDKHNGNAVMQSLNAISIRIYKDKKDKYITVPINQKVLTFNKSNNKLKIDKTKLTNLLKNKGIEDPDKFVLINRGTVFVEKNTGNLYYSNGGGNFRKNIIELKSLACLNELLNKRNQWQVPISTVLSSFDLVQVDELGTLYNRQNIASMLE